MERKINLTILFILLLNIITLVESKKKEVYIQVRANNAVSDTNYNVYFCFQSTNGDSSQNIENLQLSTGFVSPYLTLNNSNDWNIGVYQSPGCSSTSLLSNLQINLNSSLIYTFSIVGNISSNSTTLLTFSYEFPEIPTNSFDLNVYNLVSDSDIFEFQLFTQEDKINPYYQVNISRYESSGYHSMINYYSPLLTKLNYYYYDNVNNITLKCSGNFSWNYSPNFSTSFFGDGVIDYEICIIIPFAIVPDVFVLNEDYYYNNDNDNDKNWIWIGVFGGVLLTFFVIVLLVLFVYYLRYKKKKLNQLNYQEITCNNSEDDYSSPPLSLNDKKY